jgi:hypothetical protein
MGVQVKRTVGVLAGALTAVACLGGVAQAHVSRACYSTQYTYAGEGTPFVGAAKGSGNGTSKFTESEFDPTGTDLPEPGINLGGGQFTWKFDGKVIGPNNGDFLTPSDGDLRGKLAAKITWDDPSLKQTTFESTCIAELQVGIDQVVAALHSSKSKGPVEAEIEVEGWVKNMPNPTVVPTGPIALHESSSKQRAVASLSVAQDETGKITTAHLGIELGTTCYEAGNPEIGLNGGGNTTGTLKSKDPLAGRWAFPDPFGPLTCPEAY